MVKSIITNIIHSQGTCAPVNELGQKLSQPHQDMCCIA